MVRPNLSILEPASAIFLAALITSEVFFRGPFPLEEGERGRDKERELVIRCQSVGACQPSQPTLPKCTETRSSDTEPVGITEHTQATPAPPPSPTFPFPSHFLPQGKVEWADWCGNGNYDSSSHVSGRLSDTLSLCQKSQQGATASGNGLTESHGPKSVSVLAS